MQYIFITVQIQEQKFYTIVSTYTPTHIQNVMLEMLSSH